MADDKSDRYGLMTFTGPAGRTYFDRDGVLQTAAQDEPREAYDPLTGAYLGLLIEQEATNNQPFSAATRNPGNYQLFAISITAENTSRPDGVTDAVGKWSVTAGNWGRTQRTPSSRYAVAMLVKKGSEGSYFAVQRDPSASAFQAVNLSTGEVVGGETRFGLTATPVNNGWFLIRCYTIKDDAFRLGVTDNPDSAVCNADCFAYVWHLNEFDSDQHSSLIPTNGSPVTRQRDDARFTDPAVFNNFERGSLVASAKSTSGSVLSTPGQELMPAFTGKRAISWNGDTPAVVYENGQKVASSLVVKSTQEALRLLFDGNGYLPDVDVHPKPLSNSEAQQLTQNNARTVIGDCPSGGYYDYSDLSTLFVESDSSGIEIEDRTPARVGDPVGAILDKSGHGNHLHAMSDNERPILKSKDGKFFLDFGIAGHQRLAFNMSYDFSFTVFNGWDTVGDENIIVLSDSTNRGRYIVQYRKNGIDRNQAFPDDYIYYDNGSIVGRNAEGQSSSFSSLSKPTVSRFLQRQAGIGNWTPYLFGHSTTWGMSGKHYGFAWATRLSEDDALIVEKDMRRNMPAIPA